MPIEGYTEAIETVRVQAERVFGRVLRWIYDIPGEFGLDAAGVAELARTGVRASFADPAVKAHVLAEIDDYERDQGQLLRA